MRAIHLMLASAIAFGACGDDASDRAPATAAATSEQAADAPELKGPYIGRWVGKVTPSAAARRGDRRLAGRFRLELRGDGTYTTFQELDGENSGEYRAGPGRKLVFGGDRGCEEGGYDGTGVYAWSVRGDRMRLRPLAPETGGCGGRTQSLTYPSWRRR